MKRSPLQACIHLIVFTALVFSLRNHRLWAQPSKPSNEQQPASLASSAAEKRLEAQHFHALASQGTGLLIPLYQYPANVHTNPAFNHVMEVKRRYQTIPFWIILNPGTGPGQAVDANYAKAIDRLLGAGCVVIGYVSTEYGKRDKALVAEDLDRWQKFYPRIQGVFFDEMIYEDTEAAVKHQSGLSKLATQKGYWPIVSNPGADTPERYFRGRVADVTVVHESEKWPEEARIHGNYFGGYSDYPTHGRGILIHSMPKIDANKLTMMSRYAQWVYVTQDEYRINDPKAPNPWDELSSHLEELCSLIQQNQK